MCIIFEEYSQDLMDWNWICRKICNKRKYTDLFIVNMWKEIVLNNLKFLKRRKTALLPCRGFDLKDLNVVTDLQICPICKSATTYIQRYKKTHCGNKQICVFDSNIIVQFLMVYNLIMCYHIKHCVICI